MRSSIYNAGRRICIEKERLRSWLFVLEKFDVLSADLRDHIPPLTAFVENRGQRAIDVLRGSATIDAPTYCRDERLMLFECQFTQPNLAEERNQVRADVRKACTNSAQLSVWEDLLLPFVNKTVQFLSAFRWRCGHHKLRIVSDAIEVRLQCGFCRAFGCDFRLCTRISRDAHFRLLSEER